MRVTKVRMNGAGAKAILKSAKVQDDLRARAARIQAALPTGDGEQWEAQTFVGFDRAQAVVGTGNSAARRTNAEDMALLRALDRGR
ncbi:hypothetical protein SEA_BAJUNIPER_10 [Microbacterium phage BAjuniper]|nr:hypothetical protein SEA_BAJUNIPER_10 [Microbacterium phage BAjuniper]